MTNNSLISHPLDCKYKRKPVALGSLKNGAYCHYLDKGFPEAYRIWFLRVHPKRKPKLIDANPKIAIVLYGYEHHNWDGKFDSVRKQHFKKGTDICFMDGRYLVHPRKKETFKPKKVENDRIVDR